MKFNLHFEQPIISVKERSHQHLLLQLMTPPVDETATQAPIHVAIAIDRSKSMYGEKLESVIEASAALVNWLTRNDSVAVIAYDTNVEVIQPLLPLTDKFSIIERIRSIRAGSSTNLSGGWLQALRMVEEAPVGNAFRRVILLTDGMANAGIVNPDDLSKIAKDHFQRGISTTTMGFGRDFSELTLRRIASEGGGNFYFIEGPEQASSVFFDEFGQIAALYGQGMEIKLTLPPGIQLIELLNEIPHEMKDGNWILRPGDLRSDDLLNLVMVVEVDGAVYQQQPIQAECSFYNLRNNATMERFSTESKLEVGNSNQEFNTTVRVEALVARASRVLLEASRLSAERDLTAARELIRSLRNQIRESESLAPELLQRLNERLGATERNLEENMTTFSKRAMADADSLGRQTFRPISGLHNEILDLSLEGQLDLYRCPDLKANVRRALESGYRFVIINMTDLSYIDSSGIGALIQVFNWLKNRGGLLVLANVQPSVERIFSMSKLDEFFVNRDSQASARLLIEELLAGHGTS
ncbi:MAG: anti-sigma factor antagonist [Leptonema sp. (in: Bacteria)]|nr:anti-sigma factor antagonist [Leptonema sp. (in: bacteria)]